MQSARASKPRSPDAVVVGSGPNGLAAALTLARAGLKVAIYEGAETPGGGCRTEELTLRGFRHDLCSSVHPLLAASPFFREDAPAGVSLRSSAVAFAHPLERGRAAAAAGSLEDTASALGRDMGAYRRLLEPLVANERSILSAILAPLLRVPEHPIALTRFGLRGLLPITVLARAFKTEEARALLAGLGAHAMQPLSALGTGAFALVLGMLAHTVGWPVIEGGSAQLTDAMLAELSAAGADLQTERKIESLDQLPRAPITMLDVSTRGLLELAGDRLPPRYSAALRRFRYGPGACKVDWALEGPVPWEAEICRRTPTLHLGGTFEEIARSESEVASGRHPARPFCIVVQACVVDPDRAPSGQHTLYAYCHVPAGSTTDMRERIEAQIERFAPGFRERVLAYRTTTAAELEAHNPNLVGGDLNTGAATLRQTVFRPVVSLNPYRTPLEGVFLCSASTPPGGGVHGMCGLQAARRALRDLAI